MDKNIKIKLTRLFPRLFHSNLKDIVNRYREETDDMLRTEHTATLEFEKLLASSFTKEFADYLKNHFYVVVRLEPSTIPALKNNPQFIDWIANNNPECIINIPDHMMKPEYVQKYEEYILERKSAYKFSIIYTLCDKQIPKLLTKSEVLINIVLSEIKEIDNGDPTITTILNKFSYNESAVYRILEEAKKVGYSLDNQYHNLNATLKSNKLIINNALLKNIKTLLDVPSETQDYARKKIIEYIKNDLVPIDHLIEFIDRNDVNYIHFTKDEAKEILSKIALVKGERNEKIVLDFLTSNMFDFHDFDVLDKHQLFRIYTSYRNPNSKYDYREGLFANEEDLYLYLLNKLEGKYLYLFGESINEKHFPKVLELYSKNPNSIDIASILAEYSKNETMFKLAIEECLENDMLFNEISSCGFVNNNQALQDKQIFPKILKLLEKDLNKYNIEGFIRVAYSTNSEFFEYLIDNNKTEYYDCFTEAAYKDNVIQKLVYILPLNEIIKKSNLDKIYSNIIVNNSQDFDKIAAINKDCNHQTVLILLTKVAKKNNISSPSAEEIFEKLNQFKKDKLPDHQIAIDKMINGERTLNNLNYINSEKNLIYLSRIGNITQDYLRDYVNTIPDEILRKLNAKHVKTIQGLISHLSRPSEFNYRHAILGIKIYCVLGFEKSKELLTGVYGKIDEEKLGNMFDTVNLFDVPFKKEGNGFVPVLNTTLINLIFGANKNVKNTPIRNYLNDYSEKKAEMDNEKGKIILKLRNVKDATEALEKISAIQHDYIQNNEEFMNNLGNIFNDWDILQEEFLKTQNKESLSLKLNISRINKICKYLDVKRRSPELGSRDQDLLDTDVFDYVGRSSKFGSDANKAIPRTVDLSRGMENITSKKFPNVEIKRGKYTVGVYNPQDRHILSAGYKSNCCFRPSGNADDMGKDTSLLKYCTSTYYGGGMFIKDETGKIVMFSPLLRNGNVLMIHSYETDDKRAKEDKEELNKLLVLFAEEIIRQAKENGDDISFVTVSDLHDEYLDFDQLKGPLPEEQKFTVFDDEEKFKGMYNNLGSTNHMIVASKKGVTTRDIHYGPVTANYSYPVSNVYYTLDLTPEMTIEIKKLELLKDKIILLSNKKELARVNKQFDTIYELEKEIKEIKQEYLKLYKEVLSTKKGQDLFEDYRRNKGIISEICKEKKTIMPENIKRSICGRGWYIIITEDGKIIGDCLEFAKNNYERMFKYNLEFNPDLIPYPEGLKDTETSELESSSNMSM